jgi:hypothetical protein
MRGGFAFSVGVHALIILMLVFGLPFLRPKPLELPPMISVEVIDMGKETTTNKISSANKVRKVVEDETPPPPAPPPPQAQSQPAPPPVAKVEPPAPPPPETKPRPALDAAAPRLAPVDDALPELKVPDERLKPRLAPAPELARVDTDMPDLKVPAKVDLKRPEPKTPPRDFTAMLNNLTKTPLPQAPPQAMQPPVKQATNPPSGAQAPLSSKLTASENDAVRRQLDQCMNWPSDLATKNLRVELDVTVNPDRTVASARIVNDKGRMATDPTYAASARAALRAVRVPQCHTLDLPPDKYQEWQSMTINMTPPQE